MMAMAEPSTSLIELNGATGQPTGSRINVVAKRQRGYGGVFSGYDAS